MFACCYTNASVANYTMRLIALLESRRNVGIRVVSSHCKCLERFPLGRYTLVRKYSLVRCPYLIFPRSKSRILNFVINFVPNTIVNLFRGISYLRASKGCDIIHFQQSSSFAFGFLPLIPILLFSNQRKVVTVHSFSFFMPSRMLVRFFCRLYNRVDRIIVHSESMRTQLINMGVHASRIVKVFHGVNIPPLHALKRSEITFMGAPEERKGFLTVLDALRILKSKNITIKVSIYGFYSDSERKHMEMQAAMRNVDDCLFWGGRLNEKEFDMKLQQSLFTLAVYNSAISGSSVVTRAMSNATPVLASDIGGLKEYLETAGIFVPPEDPRRLAETIESLLRNTNLLESLGKKGRERAVSFLSWDAIAKEIAILYESIV